MIFYPMKYLIRKNNIKFFLKVDSVTLLEEFD